MKINYKLEYDEKTKGLDGIFKEYFITYCDVYLHHSDDVCDGDICMNCGTYEDECTLDEIVVKYGKETIFSFYICRDCLRINNLIDK